MLHYSIRDDVFAWALAKRDAPPSIQHAWTWFLLSMAGFITEPHVDASGYATWIQMLHGWKSWILMRRKGEGHSSWHDLKSFQTFVLDMTPEEIDRAFNVWVIFLGPGTQLYVRFCNPLLALTIPSDGCPRSAGMPCLLRRIH
jgi:hypothetical protein